MKLIDSEGRLFGKISVVDIIVVALVIVLALGVYTRFFTKETTSVTASDDKFTYQLAVNGVRDMTVNALSVGDKVYENENNTYIGVITDISVSDAYGEFATAEGKYVTAPLVDRKDVVLTIEAEGLISSGRYYASRTYELSVNMSVPFYTKYCTTTGNVWSIG